VRSDLGDNILGSFGLAGHLNDIGDVVVGYGFIEGFTGHKTTGHAVNRAKAGNQTTAGMAG
jgi:hypothetical protein